MKKLLIVCLILVGCSASKPDSKQKDLERIFVEHDAMRDVIIALLVKDGLSPSDAIKRIDETTDQLYDTHSNVKKAYDSNDEQVLEKYDVNTRLRTLRVNIMMLIYGD